MKLFSFKSFFKSKTLLFLLFVGMFSAMTYFFVQYKNEQANNPAREIQEVTAAVSQLMELPIDEQPTLATVTEKEKLAEQSFFKQAENGDKVLIYVGAGKAILYRPSMNKIIDVTPINPNPQLAQSESEEIQVTPAPVSGEETHPTLSITLLNGTNSAGLTQLIEQQIQREFSNFVISQRDTAQKTDYEKSLVVDLSESNMAEAKRLANDLNAQVVVMPKGEIMPDSDLLIIVGNDLASELSPTESPSEGT